MTICIDIRTLIDKQYSGIGIYTLKLLSNLFEIDKVNKYKLFYNSSNFRFVKKYYPNVDYYDFQIPNKILNLSYFIFKKPDLKKLVGDFDIFFAPNINFFDFSKNNKAKKIITIHDISFKLFPDYYSKKSLLWHNIFVNVDKILNKFDHVIAVSENTKQDLINFYNISPDKISVTYLGVDERVESCRLRVESFREKEYLLYVGTIESRKNVEGILQAFEELNIDKKIENIDLVLAGKDGWDKKYNNFIHELIGKSCFKDRIKVLNYVNEDQKIELYRNAKIFLFPSFYEGFGIPVIEAQSFGVPVITSNNSSLTEITENSAMHVNPYNINDIKEAIIALNNNESLYNHYKNVGLDNSKRFTWINTAIETLKIFEKIK